MSTQIFVELTQANVRVIWRITNQQDESSMLRQAKADEYQRDDWIPAQARGYQRGVRRRAASVSCACRGERR